MSKIATVILAAGASTRLGFNKLCTRLNGKAVVRKTVEVFLESRPDDEIIVVTGFERERVERELRALPVKCVYNPSHKEGMSSSVKAALPHLQKTELVLFHLGDKPFIEPPAIHRIIESYGRDGMRIVVPVHEGIKGHPVLMDTKSIKRYLPVEGSLEGDVGLRDIIEKHGEETLFVEGGEGAVLDLDTEEDIVFLRRRGYTIEKG